MLPGFEVQGGADFHAYILGCINVPPSLQSTVGQSLRIVTTEGSTKVVKYILDKPADVTIQLFHNTGEVESLRFIQTNAAAGTYEQVLDVSELSAGMYVCKITVGKESFTAKVYID